MNVEFTSTSYVESISKSCNQPHNMSRSYVESMSKSCNQQHNMSVEAM